MEIHDELEAILELLGDTTRNTVSLCLQRLKNCSFSLLLCQPYFPLVSLPPLSCARGFPLEPFPKSSQVCSPASCSSFVNGKESHGCRGVDLTYFRRQHLPALHHPTHWPNASYLAQQNQERVFKKPTHPSSNLQNTTFHKLFTDGPANSITQMQRSEKKATGNSLVGQESYLGI